MRVLAAAALKFPLRGRGRTSEAALPEAEFMLRFLPAVENDRADQQPRGVADRVVWLIDLFERLERADRASAEPH
jgi:hypothetical protein